MFGPEADILSIFSITLQPTAMLKRLRPSPQGGPTCKLRWHTGRNAGML